MEASNILKWHAAHYDANSEDIDNDEALYDKSEVLAAMEEYANSKLHLLQQEYEAAELKRQQQITAFANLLDNHGNLQKEYNEERQIRVHLQLENDVITDHYNEIQREAANLKEQVADLHEKKKILSEEYKTLHRWKEEAKLVLNPILDYGQSHPDIKLGTSINTFVIERCKEYDKLKERGKEYTHKLQDQLDILQDEYDKQKNISQQWCDKAMEAGRERNSLDAEYAALKAKADKMVEALFSISHLVAGSFDEAGEVFDEARIIAHGAISSYNSQTNNQNNDRTGFIQMDK